MIPPAPGESATASSVEDAGETATKYARDAIRRLHVEHMRLKIARGTTVVIDRSAARRALSTADRVLFLCHGNVCRSPMAEGYLRAALRAHGVTDVVVDSAGFVEIEGRQSPEAAVMTARAYDVDLTGHRSRRLTRDLLDRSDVAFVMDAYNRYHLRTAFPDSDTPTFLLAGVGRPSTGTVEIADPHGGGVPAHLEAYRTIVPAVAWLAEAIVVDREVAARPEA